MDDIQSTGKMKMYERRDPTEQQPSKRFKSLESMNPGHHGSPPVMETSQISPADYAHSSSSMDAIESIREMYEKIDLVGQIDPLSSFIENQLLKMNAPLEGGSSSSEGWLEIVQDGTKLAAKTVDTISTEAKSDDVEGLTLKVMKGVGEMHWVLIGLSVAAFTVASYTSFENQEDECKDLLMKILELAKNVKQYSEQMPEEREHLCNAVRTIVEGAVICCDYLKRGNFCRFWSATTAAAQLEKTNQQLTDLRGSLGLSVGLLIPKKSTMRGWDIDVFLSHSGKQKNFVRQLHRDLTREHVSCFFDEDHRSLPLAEKFPPLIFKAAEKCKIAVLVLSKEFIRSKWPMLELSTFISAMNSGKNANLKLLPIFFKISPKELSHLTKDREWQKLEESNGARGKWQDALQKVRSINGLSFGKGENKVDFTDKVVKEICCLLKRISPESHVQLLDFKPVGIEEQVGEVKALLDIDGARSALAVIVCGFGGMGKSTLAASVVKSLDWSSTDFKFCRVAIDEKALDRTSHIIKLQKDIIYDLGGGKVDLRDPHDGRLKIKEALKKKSSLLFIDNVGDKNYIKDLLPKDLSFGEPKTKLRIIITSREKYVKAELNIMCKEYEVKGLSDAASKSLLLETIHQSQVFKDIYLDEERMIDEVAAACKGVPLLLSVFGNHLGKERDKESYQEALDVLRNGDLDSYGDEHLGTKLMFVYDRITDVEVKEAFLDICTYFHAWKWNLVAEIVDIRTLRDLQSRMLVTKSASDEVIVHDILRLMGMKNARLTRFSNYKELSDALEDNLDCVGNVKGISLVSDNSLITIQSTQLETMHQSLRVLMLGDWVTLDGPPCHRAFRNLRYLRLGDITVFPFKDPSKLIKLRVLLNRSKPGMNLSHLPSGLKRISHEVPAECNKFAKLPFQNLSSLKSFIVKTRISVELPVELHLPASLVDLDLSGCKNLPKDIGHLTAIESLILDRSDLKCLPQGFGKLKKLKHLRMDYCSELAYLSEELGMLSRLEALSMEGCGNLRSLPKSLGGLLSLKKMELSKSINLQLLPESLGVLNIQKLELCWLVSLQELPSSFGNMPLLKDLSLVSCHSLITLPSSFVHLKMLETLIIINCTQLSVLPEDFGRLRNLKHMTVEDCHLLKELPHGFGALPALTDFMLRRCTSFVNLPTDFTELTSLKELQLENLPLISRFPVGFGKLKKLRFLSLKSFLRLKTLPDDFENMANLEELWLKNCLELDGAIMDKVLKLQNCYRVDIDGSSKLLETWTYMQSKIDQPIWVFTGWQEFIEDQHRAIRAALFNGMCVEVNNANCQLMERSSSTVALIMLPIHMQSHQHHILQRFVEMATETAKANGGAKLQIVCARKYVRTDQMATPTEEEERAEEESIHEILVSLPKGSCAIPSTESRRVKLLARCCDVVGCYDHKLIFFVANEVVDIEGRKCFENVKFYEEDEIPGNVDTNPLPSEIWKPKNYNSIQNFIKSIFTEYEYEDVDADEDWYRDGYVAGENKSKEFMEALQGNGIHDLLIDGKTCKVVDALHGKAIGFIICNFEFLECIKLQQIYKDLQLEDSDFIAIWIPIDWPEVCGHGTYTRLIQCMPWATFPHPQLVNIVTESYEIKHRCFVILDKHGHIAKSDALLWLLAKHAWGVRSSPFTQYTLRESFSLMESESCLEFLLHGMNIVRRKRKPMENKMTFLYAERPSEWHDMKCKLEKLTLIDGSFEVLYVGKSVEKDFDDIENLKQDYEDATQNMCWPSLSFSDMIMFWYRCKYLASRAGYYLNEESNIKLKTLHGLAQDLCTDNIRLVLLDNDGPVTRVGYEVLQMICEFSDESSDGEAMAVVKDELMKSLSRGECSPIIKTFFRDEIHNLPGHHQQHTWYSTIYSSYNLFGLPWYKCHICFCWRSIDLYQPRLYRCKQCLSLMCGRCWMAYAKQQVEQLLHCQRLLTVLSI